MSATTGRNIANTGPRRLKVTNILSTPVWGVEVKNAAAAPLLAPLFFRETVTGITLQEHKGSGTPNNAALKTDQKPFVPRCFSTVLVEMADDKIPAARKPKRRYGAMSHRVNQISNIMFIIIF